MPSAAWIARLPNEERRRYHLKQDPDQPHPFAPRRVTNKNTPGTPLSRTVWIRNGDTGRWAKIRAPQPCNICGGSAGSPVHPLA